MNTLAEHTSRALAAIERSFPSSKIPAPREDLSGLIRDLARDRDRTRDVATDLEQRLGEVERLLRLGLAVIAPEDAA